MQFFLPVFPPKFADGTLPYPGVHLQFCSLSKIPSCNLVISVSLVSLLIDWGKSAHGFLPYPGRGHVHFFLRGFPLESAAGISPNLGTHLQLYFLCEIPACKFRIQLNPTSTHAHFVHSRFDSLGFEGLRLPGPPIDIWTHYLSCSLAQGPGSSQRRFQIGGAGVMPQHFMEAFQFTNFTINDETTLLCGLQNSYISARHGMPLHLRYTYSIAASSLHQCCRFRGKPTGAIIPLIGSFFSVLPPKCSSYFWMFHVPRCGEGAFPGPTHT